MSMHIDAKPGEIADRIVLVGDPMRAKHIAEDYLENPVLVNEKRAAYCYTGTYNRQKVSVMAVGMGNPSMLIYSTELFRDYGVKFAVRAGTSGGYVKGMKMYDIVLAQATSTTSGINDNRFNGYFAPIGDFGMLCKAKELADEMGLKTYVGNVICNDRIYRDENYKSKMWAQYGILASEMEGTAFYTAAAEFGARALMMIGVILNITVDENGVEHFTDAPENEPKRTVDDMIKLALMTATESE
ncbi:MAG: purine-nucleoside phosphorylase [Oscillospiraceae bacterium]|jgi:purine-nucleoside phosphorylase